MAINAAGSTDGVEVQPRLIDAVKRTESAQRFVSNMRYADAPILWGYSLLMDDPEGVERRTDGFSMSTGAIF